MVHKSLLYVGVVFLLLVLSLSQYFKCIV
jgi:hypothetical protein